MKLVLLLILARAFNPASASQQQAHQQGRSFASSLAGTVTGAAKSTSPETVAGFQTHRPPEASLNAYALGDRALAASRTNPAAQHLKDQAAGRQSFKIDPTTDPLFTGAALAVADPHTVLKETVRQDTSPARGAGGIHTCEESGEEIFETGQEVRIVTVTPPKHRVQATFYKLWISSNNNYTPGIMGINVITGITSGSIHPYFQTVALSNPVKFINEIVDVDYAPGFTPSSFLTLNKDGQLNLAPGWTNEIFPTQTDVPIDLTLRPTEKDISERIETNCQYLEEKVEQGLCSYESLIVTQGPETRIINGCPVQRDWWKRKKVYRCHHSSLNNCGALRAKGCFQIRSACQKKVGATCVVWEQTYQCSSGKIAGKTYGSTNSQNPFCLTGNCADASYEANTELMTVMSQLSILREAQQDLRTYKVIFKGTPRKCTRNCLNFRDCCGSAKGWGISIGLSSCSKEEKELRVLRDKALCVQVGTWCATREPVTKLCITKKTSFCCYGTKLARLLQQAGRSQLGLGWGTPKTPDCAGFSAEQLSRLDFTKIDLSDLFEDIKDKMAPKGQPQSMAQISAERLQSNMGLMTKPSRDAKSVQQLETLKKKGM